MSAELPILTLRSAFVAAHARGPVVVSAPTGSGKSTEVPRWCDGRVLVVEPRRIACRSLAARVAQLEGARLGDAVGYVVRDEHVATEATRIVFATPGVVLRSRALLGSADTVVLDELHERSLDVDLLLALLVRRGLRRLVVMSATIDGDRVARHVAGEHLAGEGRAFPVDVRWLGRTDELPSPLDLPLRVQLALDAAARDPGDVLVFLPGKAEIEACAEALRGSPWAVVPLHGGLGLDEQRRAFDASPRRKVILATNVAETSLTIPGIGVVVDAGLARQTRYHDGRGFLVLAPIADDSAAQRAGRAGRTAPGVCYRLWGHAARLAPRTLPEIHRESLVPLVMAAAAWGARPEDLPMLDAPKPWALDAARADLAVWRALDADGALTEAGRGLFALPLDAPHARLLAEARAGGCLEEAIDLVAVLAVGRPLFLPEEAHDLHDDPRRSGCDVTAIVRAVRAGRAGVPAASAFVLAEAHRIRARLRALHDLPAAPPRDVDFDRDALVRAAIAADPRTVFVARSRGRDLAFGNGTTEVELARESAVRNRKDVQALVALDSRAFGAGRDTRMRVTCAAPISLAWIARAGLGDDRLKAVRVEHGRVIAQVERTFAGRAIAAREEVPTGALARDAIAQLFLRGSLFRESLATTRERLALAALASAIDARQGADRAAAAPSAAPASLEAWVAARIAALGVESGEDLALLSAADLLAPDVPVEVRAQLERDYPRTVSVGDATYTAEYDLTNRQVLLRMTRGTRQGPPPLAWLPRFAGLRVCVDGPRGVAVLRERG